MTEDLDRQGGGGGLVREDHVQPTAGELAQKLLGTTAIERLVGFVGSIVPVKADVLDNVDVDKTLEHYAAALGVPPGTMRPADLIAQMREQRAKAAQQQQQMEEAQAAAGTAKTLAETPVEDSTALNEMLKAQGLR